MALTITELQANLIAQQNAEAANIVALMEAIVDGRMGVASVDMADIVAKVNAINALDVQELQTLTDLVARVVALETAGATHGVAISALQDALTNLQNTLVTRIAAVEDNVANLTTQAASAATQAGNFVTRDELSTGMQAAAQSFINRLWAGRTRPAGLPNADGTTS